MSERRARALLGAVVLGVCALALRTDLAALSGGRFWSDGATYHAMAHSLAHDGDLRYEARDVLRSRREFSEGPQGIFLKRSTGGLRFDASRGFPWLRRLGDDERAIYYAKSFAYPLVAAPLVLLLGTRGLLLLNALALGLALFAAYAELRRHAAPATALLAALVLIGGTAAPLYLLWLTPEAFNLGVIAGALWAYRSGRVSLSALLFGIAVYSKPSNLLMALPLGIAPLIPSLTGSGPAGRLLESLRRGALLAVAAALLYGANWAVTGEWNYQGGAERKTFYAPFPLETHGVTFGNSGIWMSTNQVGPSVQGGRVDATRGAEPARAAAEFRASYLRNLAYFWIGRFGGVVPYFFPVAVAALVFVLLGPRERHGWLALAALVVSQLFFLWLIPDNWYGGSGTLGNRYFLCLLPAAVYLVPRGRAALVALVGGLGACATSVVLLLSPMHHALHPGEHAMLLPFRLFPLELTMLNDLAVFNEPWRKKQPYGDTEGDPARPRSADPRAYYLYFPDDGTYFKETRAGRPGFWLRGGARAEVLLRALEPAARVRLSVTGGPAGDHVTLRLGSQAEAVSLAADERRVLALSPGAPFPYKETAVYVLRLRSTRGVPDPRDAGRALGAFVEIELEGPAR